MNRRTLVLATLALLLASCGGEEPEPSPQDQVRTAWRAAADEAAGGDGEALCARITTAGQDRIAAQTQLPCADSVRVIASRLTDADRASIRDAQITSVTVAGDTAVVTYTGTPALAKVGFTGRTRFTKSGDQWLLAGI